MPGSETDRTSVGCLLYADDLVILSTSQHGLQNSLDKLGSSCNTWRLEVMINLDKSHVMCTSTKSINTKRDFMQGSKVLKKTDSYTYSGVELSSNA